MRLKKKRPPLTPRTPKKKPNIVVPPQRFLTEEALADLHYLEPIRSRDRLIGILEELVARLLKLERDHQ